jgi:hypothetical protein
MLAATYVNLDVVRTTIDEVVELARGRRAVHSIKNHAVLCMLRNFVELEGLQQYEYRLGDVVAVIQAPEDANCVTKHDVTVYVFAPRQLIRKGNETKVYIPEYDTEMKNFLIGTREK